jgi:hypothetical protein
MAIDFRSAAIELVVDCPLAKRLAENLSLRYYLIGIVASLL